MVEIELGVLRKQCLDRRIPSRPTLERESVGKTLWRARQAAVLTQLRLKCEAVPPPIEIQPT